MDYIRVLGERAKEAAKTINHLDQIKKVEVLKKTAEALRENSEYIIIENTKDVKEAREKGVKESLIDRMELSDERIEAMADGLVEISKLKDPIGGFDYVDVRPNGLSIGKKRVPLGVVGIIYESRPNVTVDAFGLCFKTGNVAFLRGSKDAIFSNMAIAKVIKKALKDANITEDAIILVEDVSHEVAAQMMRAKEYIDVLIPRGGQNLINKVISESTIPTIETGTGNCHTYIDEYADIEKAINIVENAKTQRYGVCNACESLVIHKKVAKQTIPLIVDRLSVHEVEIRGDEYAQSIDSYIEKAKDEDWGMEYLDKIISLKVVETIEEGIEHINKYNTGHSEAIITEHIENASLFQERVDAAAVYINASTRFTDGEEFGYGAEIGISTQKLHARGPMGLFALTTTKFIIIGQGQIRN